MTDVEKSEHGEIEAAVSDIGRIREACHPSLVVLSNDNKRITTGVKLKFGNLHGLAGI